MKITENNADRLVLGLMEQYGVFYHEALALSTVLPHYFRVGDKITHSVALQAALITAVNCGKRAFLGGVYRLYASKCSLVVAMAWYEFPQSLGRTVRRHPSGIHQ